MVVKHTIHVVVTCTQSKRGDPSDGALMRNLPEQGDTRDRCRTWVKRLDGLSSRPIVVRDLYAGGHWSVARGLDQLRPPGAVRLWVISAGYGLLTPDDQVQAYGASFSAGVDSVVRSGSDLPLWWEELASHQPKGVGNHPRTLRDIVDGDRDSSLLVVGSPPYLKAVQEDLVAAISALRDSDRAAVVSSGGRDRLPRLDANLLDVDARLQSIVGGAMPALNVRIARDLLERDARRRDSNGLSLSWAQQTYGRLQAELEEFRYPERKKLSDRDVLTFIASEVRRDHSSTKTGLLRKLRESGQACEQSRFATLFNRTVASLNE